MSITIDYFFNFEGNLEDLTAKVNSCLGSNLQPYDGNSNDLFDRFLSMELSLSTHTLENDTDLNFEDFQYEIGIRNSVPDGDVRDMVSTVMGLIPSLLYRRGDIKEGILIYDVQILLARYTERIEDSITGLFDEVSGVFVESPRHISDINSRIGQPWQSSAS